MEGSGSVHINYGSRYGSKTYGSGSLVEVRYKFEESRKERLTYTADAVISEHERPGLDDELPGLLIAYHGSRQT
jgi:hypothetical protein